MTILTRSLTALRRSRHLGPNLMVTSLWVALLSGLEWSGDRVRSEIADVLALSLLVTFAIFTVRLHRDRAPLLWIPPLARLVRRLGRWASGMGFQIGFDFRRIPPIESRVPAVLAATCGGLVAVFGLLTLIGYHSFPGVVRETIGSFSYLLYLAMAGALWTLLIVSTFLLVAFLLASVHDGVVARRERISVRTEILVHCALFVALLGIASAAPVRWAVWTGSLGVLACLSVVLSVPRTAIPILWRGRRASDLPATLTRRSAALILLAVAVEGVGLLVLLSLGGLLSGVPEDEHSPMTFFLGRTFLWSACAATWMLVVREVRDLRVARALSRPQSFRRQLTILGAPEEERGRLRYFWQEHGWEVLFGGAPKRDDGNASPKVSSSVGNTGSVALCWKDSPVVRDPWQPTEWPLAFDTNSYTDPELVPMCERRYGLQRRRRLVRGMERLFKSVGRRQDGAEGSWFAPQYDFLSGLVREGVEAEIDLEHEPLLVTHVGLSYAEVYTPEVRVYFGHIMRALEIDLVFVEDGVGARRFRRVLDNLFETYDVFGGEERAEERHVAGIPGVRAIFHEYAFDQPYRSDVYPEPEYSPVARARILHVFKDRGEEEEVPDWLPLDFENAPVGGLSIR